VEIRKPGAWERDSLVLVAFLSYTDARVSEALKATVDDLMFDKGLIRIKGVKKAGLERCTYRQRCCPLWLVKISPRSI